MDQHNSYPLKDWHFEHMQKTIVKFVSGLSELESGSSWKRKQHKKYSGNIGYVRRNIQSREHGRQQMHVAIHQHAIKLSLLMTVHHL